MLFELFFIRHVRLSSLATVDFDCAIGWTVFKMRRKTGVYRFIKRKILLLSFLFVLWTGFEKYSFNFSAAAREIFLVTNY